jgi:hypothetical protein
MILRCHSNRDGQNGARRCGSSLTKGTLLLFRLIIQEKLRATYGFRHATMVRKTDHYVREEDRHRVRRSVVAKQNLAWEAKGVDPVGIIETMLAEDKWTALYLRLMYAFGLRLKEASHLRPEIMWRFQGVCCPFAIAPRVVVRELFQLKPIISVKRWH